LETGLRGVTVHQQVYWVVPLKRIIRIVSLCSLSLTVLPVHAQTFEVPGQAEQPKQTSPAKPGKGNKPAAAAESPGSLGWGSSIEVGRMARAAEDALKKGNASAAANYAERAVQAAPQNTKLWFLLGYASRLAGHLQQSLDAYQKGLAREPNSVEGLSGMAQTYAKLGNTAEAKRLLTRVVAANPRRVDDLLILGEMYIRSGDLQQGIQILQRAEALQPSAHSELLMAVAYMQMKEPDKAKQLLDSAKRRAPNNPEIFRAVANYYRQTRDYKGAIQTLKNAPGQSAELLGDLAYTYELDGDKKEAAAVYGRAANAAPNTIGFQLSAAQATISAGDTSQGKQYLARAAAIDPNSYRLHAIRAGLAKVEDRPAEAIAEYNFALAHLPESPPEGQLYPILLHMNLAELYKADGQEAAAQQQLAIADKQMATIQVEGPAKAEFLRVRASIKSTGGDYAGAETDLLEALKLDANNLAARLQFANLLWNTDRKDEARKIYSDVISGDPKNRFALEGLGYLSRDAGDNKAAEEYFNRMAAAYPNDYVAYLALGDLYTDTRDFTRAEDNYQKAYKGAPRNPIILANAANAAIEAHKFDSAGEWLARATGPMLEDSKVMLEQERWLFHIGKYQESADVGTKVVEKMPRDRNASVYLGYALYNLGRLNDVLALSTKYEPILPKEPNFPLLAGHVHKQNQLLDDAVEDYSRAIARDPKMVEAYVNRGYVLNDLQDPEASTQDFNAALRLAPNNGIAHLGLAFASLQLHKSRLALDQTDAAEKLMGDSGAIHLARATAFRQMRVLDKAEKEYRAALTYAPNDLLLNKALADTLYHARRYSESLQVLTATLALSPNDPQIYGEMAHAAAQLRRRDDTLKYVEAAERSGGTQSAVLLDTGDALLTLGDHSAAMDRFARALNTPDADKVAVRLSIAKVFVGEGKSEDAKQQVSLAFAESRIGEADPLTADNLVDAANIFLSVQDFELAQRYYNRAHDMGAADDVVAIGLANADLARGNALEAESHLASLGSPDAYTNNYDYVLAQANVYRQRHDTARALTAFARAHEMAAQDEIAERSLQEVAGEEGLRLSDRFSVQTSFEVNPIFEDETIYTVDAKLFGVQNTPSLMPPPRSSLETMWTSAYRAHLSGWPALTGFFQVRNARGQVSVPSQDLILDRNTYDYSFNNSVSPVLHLGSNTIALNTGIQFTLRRDGSTREAAAAMNQNLFRQFLYLSTNSFANWIAVRGSAFHEGGPFTARTEGSLNSREVGARLEFIVGRPWAKTFLLTGYSIRDLQFKPLVREFFTTSTYAGVERTFGTSLKVTAVGEYLRSWRLQDQTFALGQTMRPAAQVEYRPNNRWSVNGNFAYSRGEGFHAYDNMQSGFLISYMKPLRRSLDDRSGTVPVEYPLRLSIGIQQQTFFSFTGRGQAMFRPIFRLTLF
jgi:tetratricopeptide (TPR) repeat protein